MNTRKVVMLCLVLLLLSTVVHARIVFSSKRNGVVGAYVMEDDGSNQTLLIEGKMVPFPYCWSPDGKQIVFKGKFYHLYLMNADGTNVRKLVDKGPAGYINIASFSPDGQSLVFHRSFQENNKNESGTYVLNIETGDMEKISDFWGVQHDWSPDGKHIICAEPSTHGVHNTIYIMDADGDNLRPLIPAALNDGEFTIIRKKPRWSHDGKQIVFLQKEYKVVWGGRFFKAFRYRICNRNGGNIQSLHIPKDMQGISVDWMDDGESIVFSAIDPIPLNQPLPHDFEEPLYNIHKYHIRTRVRTRLTNHPGQDQTLDWISDDVLPVSPKGKKKVTWGTLKQ